MERQLTEGRPFSVLLRYALPVCLCVIKKQ